MIARTIASMFVASWSSTTVIALALTPEFPSGIAIIISAIFVGLVNLYIAWTARLVALKEMRATLAPVEAKIDALAPVVAKIDGHVNSEKTKSEGELAAHKIQIELQREMIEEMRKAAALLAQAKATTEILKTGGVTHGDQS